MQEVETPPIRRNLVDAGYTVLLLTIAVVVGYGVLQPTTLRANVVARERPVNAALLPGPERPPVPAALPPSTAEPPTPVTPPAPAIAPAPAPATASLPPAAVTPPPAVVPAPPAATPAPREAKPVPPAAKPVAPPAPEAPRITWADTVTGKVLGPDRQPVEHASVVAGGREIYTGADGTFTLDHPPAAVPILVKMPGFEKTRVEPTRGPLEVVLKPQRIRAAYFTYYGFGSKTIRNRVLDMVARTELNAVVIDVKGDRGWVLYKTNVEMALAAGAQGPATVKNFDDLMADLKARGIYTIARIVTFKDNVLAHAHPEWAIVDTRTGKLWTDREKLAWMDPFREEVWSYNIAIAQEAIDKGFDEVQFDYVRFPTDGRLSAARYSKPNNKDTRLPTIVAFLDRAHRELGRRGAYVSADLFGYTAFNDNDTDIGQRIEEIAPHVDFVCPMVYPSGYQWGIPGYRNPVAHPYEVVHESVRLLLKRSAGSHVRVRPWIQDFRDYAFDRRVFGVSQIREQIRGADEAGGAGWMLWNPRNDYTASALRGKGSLAAK